LLSRDDNELLVRTAPGTPMGALFRRYWIPALLATELPHPDSDPVRIRLLSEDLIAFRDSSGQVGLVAANCPHRGASLFFGRNEEAGLRCVYHGWKFDVTGQCVDMPNEPAESDFRTKVRATAYPCIERGGVVWTYMGPPEQRPAPPDLEWAVVPAEQRYVSKRWQETNYAQAMEGGIDSSHISFLHRDETRTNGRAALDLPSSRYTRADTAPHFEVVDTEYGFLIGARRKAEEDSHYWRITQWLMPWYTMIPPFGDMPIGGHAWVPIDDENCWTFSVNWHPTRALTDRERQVMSSGGGLHPEKIPGTFRPVRNKTNDYQIDRQLQRSGKSFTGISGLSEQDLAVQESMGAIYDRTNERLGSADAAIIQMRRRLLKAARELEQGIEPPGLRPESFQVRSVSIVLPRDVPSWPEASSEAMTARADKYFVSVA
jgi:phthalate 4,5-dioxygenase oxygenase subunit